MRASGKVFCRRRRRRQTMGKLSNLFPQPRAPQIMTFDWSFDCVKRNKTLLQTPSATFSNIFVRRTKKTLIFVLKIRWDNCVRRTKLAKWRYYLQGWERVKSVSFWLRCHYVRKVPSATGPAANSNSTARTSSIPRRKRKKKREVFVFSSQASFAFQERVLERAGSKTNVSN